MLRAPPLLELLTPVACPEHWEVLTCKQQVNIMIYLETFRKYPLTRVSF